MSLVSTLVRVHVTILLALLLQLSLLCIWRGERLVLGELKEHVVGNLYYVLFWVNFSAALVTGVTVHCWLFWQIVREMRGGDYAP